MSIICMACYVAGKKAHLGMKWHQVVKKSRPIIELKASVSQLVENSDK